MLPNFGQKTGMRGLMIQDSIPALRFLPNSMADPPNTLQPINPEALDRLTAEERGRRRGELAEAHFASVIRRIVARTNGVLIPSLVEGAQREISPELTRIFTQRQAELAEERRKQQIERGKGNRR